MVPSREGRAPYLIEKRVLLSGTILSTRSRASIRHRGAGGEFRFSAAGARKFAQGHHENVGKRFAAVLDKECSLRR